MIKKTWQRAKIANASKLFVIAGGPGLSSLTLRDLDILQENFDLIYLDMQGTNGSSYEKKKTFSELCSEIVEVVRKENGTKYILGHSFGGIMAAEVFASESTLNGLICIASPFSTEALSSTNITYKEHKTLQLDEMEKLWSEREDNSSFSRWLSEYGELYYKNKKGKEVILTDRVSAQFFKDNRSDVLFAEQLLEKIAENNKLKVFIAGKEDKLLASHLLKKDALKGNFNFFEVEGASHFVTIDQPKKIAGLIENLLLRSEKR